MTDKSRQGVWVDRKTGAVRKMSPEEMPPPTEVFGPGSDRQPTKPSIDFNQHVRLYDHQRIPNEGILLDSCDNLVLKPKDLAKYASRISALHGLAIGLEHLAHQFSIESSKITKRECGLMINFPAPVIANLFRWFSVSSWDFIHGIGRVAEDAGLLSGEKGSQYATRIAGPIKAFRDKVGAHAAALTTNRHDSFADRELSVIAGTCSVAGDIILCPPYHRIEVDRGDSSSTTDPSFTPWSLPEAWAVIYSRYLSRPGEQKGNIIVTSKLPFTSLDASISPSTSSPSHNYRYIVNVKPPIFK